MVIILYFVGVALGFIALGIAKFVCPSDQFDRNLMSSLITILIWPYAVVAIVFTSVGYALYLTGKFIGFVIVKCLKLVKKILSY